MRKSPSLLTTLKEALKELETAGLEADTNLSLEYRYWIEIFQESEETDHSTMIETLQDHFLNRKGIMVAARLSAANVRTILRKKGFKNLAEEHSNESIVRLFVDVHKAEYGDICKMQERLELQTARMLVESAGLDWPEDEET
jgi:hypothetical protein